MVVQGVEELQRRVQDGWRLTRDRKGFKMRGPGGRWERVSRDLEVVAAELYETQRSERGGRARGCEGLLKEKERQCLEGLEKCSNTYIPLALKSLRLIIELGWLAKGDVKGLPALPKEARDALMTYVMPKARRLSSEIVKALKEYEGFNDDDLTEALRTPSYEPASRSQP
ncbi:MAG: hypothetical protein RXP86_11690 [Acidilobus sp.]